MKKKVFSFLLFVFVLFLPSSYDAFAADSESIEINATNFEDKNLRAYVRQEYDKNQNGSLEKEEITAANTLMMGGTPISSPKGLELLTNLDHVSVFFSDAVTSLNLKNLVELKNLAITTRRLEIIDISQNKKLERLSVWSDVYYDDDEEIFHEDVTALTLVSGSKNRLKKLSFHEVKVNEPDYSTFSALEELEIRFSNVGERVDVRGLAHLKKVQISVGQKLKEVLFGDNAELEEINIEGCPIRTITIRELPVLKQIFVDSTYDSLESVTIGSIPSLQKVYFAENYNIREFLIDDCPEVVRLFVLGSKKLTYLDVSSLRNLIELDVSGSAVKSIDIRGAVSLQRVHSSEQVFKIENDQDFGWKTREDGSVIYILPDGNMATGITSIGGIKYDFGENGELNPGAPARQKKYMFSDAGELTADCWSEMDGEKIHSNYDGSLSSGWKQIDGNWYLFQADNGYMLTGWQKVAKVWYYLSEKGKMKTGWMQENGKWYFLNPNGSMAVGWKKLNGKWYYMRSNGVMAIGWTKVKNKWYYFNKDGSMASNEWINGYYLDKDGTWNGKAQAGWRKSSKGWWYGNPEGWYAKNATLSIDGKDYSFDKNGYLK